MALEIWPKIGLSGKIRVIASYWYDAGMAQLIR